MTVTEIPFNQMFHFETRPRIIPVSQEIVPPVPSATSQIDWKKIILISGGVIVVSVIAYQIWKFHQKKTEQKTEK